MHDSSIYFILNLWGLVLERMFERSSWDELSGEKAQLRRGQASPGFLVSLPWNKAGTEVRTRAQHTEIFYEKMNPQPWWFSSCWQQQERQIDTCNSRIFEGAKILTLPTYDLRLSWPLNLVVGLSDHFWGQEGLQGMERRLLSEVTRHWVFLHPHTIRRQAVLVAWSYFSQAKLKLKFPLQVLQPCTGIAFFTCTVILDHAPKISIRNNEAIGELCGSTARCHIRECIIKDARHVHGGIDGDLDHFRRGVASVQAWIVLVFIAFVSAMIWARGRRGG